MLIIKLTNYLNKHKLVNCLIIRNKKGIRFCNKKIRIQN